MNEIEKYIQFAIDNEYKPEWLKGNHKSDIKKHLSIKNWIELEWNLNLWVNFANKVNWIFIYDKYFNEYYLLEKEITSKEFITAITRWLMKEVKKESIDWSSPIFYVFDKFELVSKKKVNIKRGMIREITTNQAMAIKDGELEDFITNLLEWTK